MRVANVCDCAYGRKQTAVLGIWIGCLTSCSLVVVFLGAAQEPYAYFDANEALVQVGLGMSLLALWAERLTSAIALVVRGRLSKWWLLAVAWGIVVSCYLAISPFGYVEDVARFGVR
jgi:hypothetical protein